MLKLIVLTVVELIACLCAFLGIGQAVGKEATKFDKVAGYVVCIGFLLFVLFIEGVVR